MSVTEYFQHIYVINLPTRPDRKQEMLAEFENIGLGRNHPIVEFFPAVRPESAGEFPSIGARGCFLSHLGVLRDAQEHGYERILILEDDLNFSRDFGMRINGILAKLHSQPWGLFYGGYAHVGQNSLPEELMHISSGEGIQQSHFIGVQAPAINQLINYFDLMLSRQGGDPLGGPMHVDGAYSWFRRHHPDLVTLVAVPELGYQRASKTDIHDLGVFDKLPLLKNVAAFVRRIKNRTR